MKGLTLEPTLADLVLFLFVTFMGVTAIAISLGGWGNGDISLLDFGFF